MKTFKHKKTGWTAEDLEETLYTIYKPLKVGTLRAKVGRIPEDLVEDSSDWEEIIPKEWEILSFVNEDNKLIYKIVNGECLCCTEIGYSDIGTRSMQYCKDFYKIHSAKRLSDGVIFSLGDVISYGITYTISSISVEDDKALLWVDGNSCNLSIECAKKVEELHTTKDGYKINTGDKYFIVENFRIREVVGGTFTKSKWDGFRFKERDNAENWVINNKPCLTLNDVMTHTGALITLSELIKTRI